MKCIKKLACKLKNRVLWLGWWLRLRRQVSGRIKLRGSLNGLSIERSFYCDGDLWLGIYSDEGKIHIGQDVQASGPLIITAIHKVTIGKGVLFGPNILITDHYHGDPQDPMVFDVPPSSRRLHTRGPIEIEDYAQIGANATILSPAKIGRSTILGANSVVSRDLSPRTIHAGVPARPLKSNPASFE